MGELEEKNVKDLRQLGMQDEALKDIDEKLRKDIDKYALYEQQIMKMKEEIHNLNTKVQQYEFFQNEGNLNNSQNVMNVSGIELDQLLPQVD